MQPADQLVKPVASFLVVPFVAAEGSQIDAVVVVAAGVVAADVADVVVAAGVVVAVAAAEVVAAVVTPSAGQVTAETALTLAS